MTTTRPLTPRQYEVVELLAAGYHAAAIGRRLGISRKRVHDHIAECGQRLGLRGRIALIDWYRRQGERSSSPDPLDRAQLAEAVCGAYGRLLDARQRGIHGQLQAALASQVAIAWQRWADRTQPQERPALERGVA